MRQKIVISKPRVTPQRVLELRLTHTHTHTHTHTPQTTPPHSFHPLFPPKSGYMGSMCRRPRMALLMHTHTHIHTHTHTHNCKLRHTHTHCKCTQALDDLLMNSQGILDLMSVTDCVRPLPPLGISFSHE